MISAFRTLLHLVGILRGPSREEWNLAEHRYLSKVTTEHWAKCTMLVRRGLLPDDWESASVKVSREDWDALEKFHERMLRDDPEYKKEYLAELKVELLKAEDWDAMLRERGLFPYGERTKR